jgi:flagellar hook assembly protein FlgD
LPEGLSSYHVIIKIYNSLGQLIAVLTDAEQSAGQYRIIWNGTDIKGLPVASGVYFYSLDAGEFRQIRKMILLR